MLGAILAAIPAVASLASGLLGKKKTGGGETVSVGGGGGYEDLLKLLPSDLGKEYSGKLTADASSFEKYGLGLLNNYLQSPATGDLFSAAKGQIMDTLGGKYADVSTSPFLKAMKVLAGQGLTEDINTARRSQGARGSFFHSKALEEETNLRSKTQNYLNALLGQMMETERGRMFEAVSPAMQMEQYSNITAPQAKIAASQTYGALPRILEQANLEANYQEWQRARQEKFAPATLVGGSYQPTRTFTTPTTYGDSSLSRILQAIPGLFNIGKDIFSGSK